MNSREVFGQPVDFWINGVKQSKQAIAYSVSIAQRLEEGGFIEMLETRLEVKKTDVEGLGIKDKVTIGGKDFVVVSIEEDANDPILNVRCGPEDL